MCFDREKSQGYAPESGLKFYLRNTVRRECLGVTLWLYSDMSRRECNNVLYTLLALQNYIGVASLFMTDPVAGMS